MNTTRRDLLKFISGSAAGALFTPAPWRLITDTALWSENWPGIPRPQRGEALTRFTHCGLCPAGCAVRARCIGGQPVSLAGVSGGLCAFGVAGHHLPFHPARVRATAGLADAAKERISAAMARCSNGEQVAVLDLYPGRSASWTYRRAMASIPNGVYIAPPQPAVSVNLDAARTVLSLGAPLLDGWISPARAFAARGHFRLIQAESVESRTAALADRWIPTRPGEEEAVLPELTRELRENGPALVIDSGMSPNVVALNIAVGGWGTTILPRAEAPAPAEWKNAAPVKSIAELRDHSLRVLIIDQPVAGQSIPWNEIRGKLVEDRPLVAGFGFAEGAEIRLSVAVYPEAMDDVPASIDSPAPLFRLNTSLTAPPSGAVSPAEFIADVAGLQKTDFLRERAAAIHAAGRGELVSYRDSAASPIQQMTVSQFWDGLNAGGFWRGEAPDPGPPPRMETTPVPAPPDGMAVIAAGPAIESSPLLSKIYRESGLRLGRSRVALHPACGIREGARAVLQTDRGNREVQVTLDSGIRPGVVLASEPELAGARAKVVAL